MSPFLPGVKLLMLEEREEAFPSCRAGEAQTSYTNLGAPQEHPRSTLMSLEASCALPAPFPVSLSVASDDMSISTSSVELTAQ